MTVHFALFFPQSPLPATRTCEKLGNQLEHRGISDVDLRSWCENSGVLDDVQIERVQFLFEGGMHGTFETGEQFQLLTLSCTKKID